MKQLTFLILLFFASLSFAQPTQKEIVGNWEGKLSVQGTTLTLIFHVKMEKGVLVSTMDVPEQGAKDIACEKTEYANAHLKITIPRLMGKYEGDWSNEKNEFVGKWVQGGQEFELGLHKTDKATTINRPQEPKAPFPYKIEEVTFENPKGGHKLAGTLTLPKKGKAPFPAVILVSGSGPQDRDETILGHKPFWVIADDLSRNGIAVLRYDDRGVGKSGGNFATATSEDFATDALAAFQFLKGNKQINAKKIGIAGHSEGGMIAPMVAAQASDVGFLILLAGTGVDGGEILLEQGKLIAQAEGIPAEAVAKIADINKEIYDIMRSNMRNDEIERKMEARLIDWGSTLSKEDKMAMAWTDESPKQMIKELTSPWMRFFIRYNPAPTLEKVKCPVLALNGEKDIQVPSKQNLPAIQLALKKGGNANVKIMEIPQLNHLFQTCEKCSVSEYAELEETFSPNVLKIMREWILKL
jgi:fermentation-respiration switch protein FrsA (DUF1100 family)